MGSVNAKYHPRPGLKPRAILVRPCRGDAPTQPGEPLPLALHRTCWPTFAQDSRPRLSAAALQGRGGATYGRLPATARLSEPCKGGHEVAQSVSWARVQLRSPANAGLVGPAVEVDSSPHEPISIHSSCRHFLTWGR